MTLEYDMMNEVEAARFMTLSHLTLRRWRSTSNKGPPYHKLGASVRYNRGDLETWMTSNTVNPRERNHGTQDL